MPIYNYVRPLWNNGVHVVHDVPEAMLRSLKGHFGPGSVARLANDDVQVARIAEAGLTLAWILLEIQLPTENTDFSYRRARYLHVIVSPDPEWKDLDIQSARTLFTQVYGEDLRFGIAAGQIVLQRFAFPQDADEARDLFVGRASEAGDHSTPVAESPRRREPDPWHIIEPPRAPEPPPFPDLEPAAPASNPSWVALGQFERQPVAFDPADAGAAADPGPTPPASLSGLLRGRLSEGISSTDGELTRPWPAVDNDSSHPQLEESPLWRATGDA
jgi:hypothetical protein